MAIACPPTAHMSPSSNDYPTMDYNSSPDTTCSLQGRLLGNKLNGASAQSQRSAFCSGYTTSSTADPYSPYVSSRSAPVSPFVGGGLYGAGRQGVDIYEEGLGLPGEETLASFSSSMAGLDELGMPWGDADLRGDASNEAAFVNGWMSALQVTESCPPSTFCGPATNGTAPDKFCLNWKDSIMPSPLMSSTPSLRATDRDVHSGHEVCLERSHGRDLDRNREIPSRATEECGDASPQQLLGSYARSSPSTPLISAWSQMRTLPEDDAFDQRNYMNIFRPTNATDACTGDRDRRATNEEFYGSPFDQRLALLQPYHRDDNNNASAFADGRRATQHEQQQPQQQLLPAAVQSSCIQPVSAATILLYSKLVGTRGDCAELNPSNWSHQAEPRPPPSIEVGGDERKFHVPAPANANANANAAPTAPHNRPFYRTYSDDRDRMVYVSWIPKKARAYNTGDKRRMELELKKKLKEDLHLVGLAKVLLFPPKGVHCKLIFETREMSTRFMERYGGENASVETERWKVDMCRVFDIDMHEKFDKTVVKIEWSQK